MTNLHTHTLLTSASKTKINFFDIFMSGDWWVFEVATTQTLIFWHFQKFKYPFFYHLKKKSMPICTDWNCTFFPPFSSLCIPEAFNKPSEKEPCSLTHLYSSQKVMVVGTTTQQSSTTLLRLLMMMEPVFMTNIKMTPRAPEWRRFDSEILKGN